MTEARYTIGVDLGTTNCAAAFVDLTRSEKETVALDVLEVPQVVAPGEIGARTLLPSFLYLPHKDELERSALTLPWARAPEVAVGELARKLGAQTPIRLISSAKSWLCHPDVDRRAAILPPDAPADVARRSPLEASVAYLEHLRHAWDTAHRDAPFKDQDVTITVPASFDPAARELTAEAAQKAGYVRLTLLEEPQAALYSWLETTGPSWREQVSVGDVVLVVDIGGGTSDFSLIAVEERERQLELRRVAVGDHILLGGDNMDLALAHLLHAKLGREGKRLDAWQVRALTHGSRHAKELLLSDDTKERVPVVVPSRGSKLVGGTLRTELTRDEVSSALLKGFFPEVEVGEKPGARERTALTQLGLPYAQDAAITRHLAAFLTRHRDALAPKKRGASFVHPTALLFNGGVLKSKALVERVTKVVQGWLRADGGEKARVLTGTNEDLAVARGAAYYGFVRRGGGVRIRGGTAKSFYVGVEAAMPAVPGVEPPVQALCVAPFGMEEGTGAELPAQEFGLVIGERVRFRFFGSSVRRDDPVGAVLDYWADGELEELDGIEAKIAPSGKQRAGDIVPVRLRAAITELGTLRLEAVSRDGGKTWNVEFSVRGKP